jgi:uncharacterized protein YggE
MLIITHPGYQGDEAMKKVPMLLTGCAMSLLAPAVASAQISAPNPPLAGTRLDIVAEGEVQRVPDVAVIGAGVVTQAQTAGAAMAENASRMAATIAALRKAGVADRDIQSSNISLTPQYRYGENMPPVLTGYQASNQVNVRFRDIRRSGAILDTLVAAGANQINGPNLMIEKPEAALDEARQAAVAKARARATLYAGASGLQVFRIISISEQGYSPPPPSPVMAMSRMEKSADTPVQPGEQTLSIAVSVSFELR